jgi:hypothetical protein
VSHLGSDGEKALERVRVLAVLLVPLAATASNVLAAHLIPCIPCVHGALPPFGLLGRHARRGGRGDPYEGVPRARFIATRLLIVVLLIILILVVLLVPTIPRLFVATIKELQWQQSITKIAKRR